MKKWVNRLINCVYYTLLCVILVMLVIDTVNTSSPIVEVTNMIVFLLVCITVKLDILIDRTKLISELIEYFDIK